MEPRNFAVLITILVVGYATTFSHSAEEKETVTISKKKSDSKSSLSNAEPSSSCDSSYLLLKHIRCMLDSKHLLNVLSLVVNIRDIGSLRSALDMQVERIEDGLAEGKSPRKVSIQDALGALAVPIFMNVDKHADYEMPQMIWKTLESKTDDVCLLINDLALCGVVHGLPCLTSTTENIQYALKFLPKQAFGINLESLDLSSERLERMIKGLTLTLPALIPTTRCLPYTREITLTYACVERVAFESQESCLADVEDVDEKELAKIKSWLHWGYGYFLGSIRYFPPRDSVCHQYEQIGRCLWQQVSTKCMKEFKLALGSQAGLLNMLGPKLADGLFAGVCPSDSDNEVSRIAATTPPTYTPPKTADNGAGGKKCPMS